MATLYSYSKSLGTWQNTLSLPSRYGSSIYCCKASQAFIHNRALPNGRLQGRHKDSSAEINYKKMAWGEETTNLHLGWQGRKRQDHSERCMWQDSEVLLLWLKDGELTTQVYIRTVLSKTQLLKEEADWCSPLYPGQAAGKSALKRKQMDKTHPMILQFVLWHDYANTMFLCPVVSSFPALETGYFWKENRWGTPHDTSFSH